MLDRDLAGLYGVLYGVPVKRLHAFVNRRKAVSNELLLRKVTVIE